MSRLARVVIPGLPHHVTQRGNGGARVFFTDADYRLYRDLLAENCRKAKVACWAYALLPTQIHLILVPADADGLRAALAPVHRSYAGLINQRRKRKGHFWQGRYGAAALDDTHLAAIFRAMLLASVKARQVKRPDAWPWSSARAYLKGTDDGITKTSPLSRRFRAIRALLADDSLDEFAVSLDETIGRPHGDAEFLKELERRTGRTLAPAKRGPKPKRRKKR
jgi:putative transposase